ncbi:hypothetical protein JCM19235_1358 [Vibrio maritimus]|uniref:Uncharacterized protein n=1 Tax=Vibrio maritimus TaxID=990268 RepID=A0A090SUQ6_9VIBR|nr:hypothetical protein JCM19235_1358 [Vibrio maritimus]
MNVECGKQVMARLEDINTRLNVEPLLSAAQSFLDKHGVKTKAIHLMTQANTKFEVEVDLSTCGVRARKVATAILSRGIDMKADARRGGNRLKGVKPTYLALIQDKLNRDQQFTHDQLKELIVTDRPDCKPTAISNHASFAAQALLAIGVIEKTRNGYELTD